MFGLEFICRTLHIRRKDRFETADESDRILVRIMKNNFRTDEKRSELSALIAVISLLMVGTLAKVGAATQLFHLVH